MKHDGVVLATIELTKRFGGLIALDNVNINIKRNSLTLLIGPNGAGKSTLINTCVGILKPDKGRVLFSPTGNGVIDITGWSPHEVYKAGFVRSFQIPQPFLSLTVLENVLTVFTSRGEDPLYAIFRSMWRKVEKENIEKAFKVLKLVGLDDYWDVEAYKLGAGQLKMLEVARALAANAKLIALDEPIGGTDPSYAKTIFEKLRKIKGETDITFIVVEHRIDIALPFADYVYVMDKGKIIAEGSPDIVYRDPKVVEIYVGE
ncbi:MAG: ABC transporter ATP-binding protein [Ignisphaera sp.]